MLLKPEHLLDMPGATVYFLPQWLASAHADALLKRLTLYTAWEQPIYHFHGNAVPMPRQVAWHGDAGASYGYSGLRHEPLPWTADLGGLRDDLASDTAQPFNSVLLNRYRDGKDSVAWHADNEPELGPFIASVSLGATRTFSFKPKAGGDTIKVELSHGSLLLMAGDTQRNWLHQIPKTAKPVGERINLTFRQVRLSTPR
jgi:alkylated DNA repair dioxygenase AlkB